MSAVAITRIALCSALGMTLDATVEKLQACAVGTRVPVDLEQTPRVVADAGEVPLSVPPQRQVGPRRAEHLLARVLADLLTDDDRAAIARAPHRWGAVVGTTLAGMRHCGVGMRAEESGREEDSNTAYARTCASSVLAHAIRSSGIAGPTINVSCACASALSAVSHACALLLAGEVDAIIAGGYDPISEFAYGGFSALQLVSIGPLSPFATDREGMKLGEGAVLMLLRRVDDLDTAERARIHGVITASAETSDAHHLTQPHPAGAGAARALAAVCEGRSMPEVVVAHATGTSGNDAAEYEAYKATFGSDLRRIPVVALKSRFGHPLGAAGLLETVAVIGCAARGFLPSSAGRGRDRTAFPELDLVEGPPRDAAPREIVALSAGFGGANAAIRIRSGEPAHGFAARPWRKFSPVTITAVGVVSPAGRGLASLIARSRSRDPWGEFSEETLVPLLDRAKSRRLALLPRLMIAAVRDLIDTAQLDASDLRETPLIAANWCGAADFTERYYRDLVRSGIDLANPLLFAESVPNIGSAQCSLAFGIEAATISVIGRRTAAAEAVSLASVRIASGEWPRAIVVAAEESHHIVRRVLSRCADADVPLRSGAVAWLLESPATGGRQPMLTIDRVIGRSASLDPRAALGLVLSSIAAARTGDCPTVSTDSPLDRPVAESISGCQLVSLAEMGAASALAAGLIGEPDITDDARWSISSDPHGAAWAMLLRRSPSPTDV